MTIYTRGGDDGETGLFGGARVPKDHVRIHAYGEVDELNAVLGWCRAAAEGEEAARLQRECARLFTLGAHLATPPDAGDARGHLPAWPQDAVDRLEHEIDDWETRLEPLRNFVLPGGSELAARLHVARTVCRRVERAMMALRHAEGEGAFDRSFLVYVNRLSDWLFTISREANRQSGVADLPWKPPGRD